MRTSVVRSSLFLSRILACAALVVFVVALSGCSSGGAGAPIAPAITLTYTPDPGTGISQVTTADGAGSSAGVAEVEIYVTDVLGVLAHPPGAVTDQACAQKRRNV